MAVSENTPLKAYTASGASAVFAYDFPVLSSADMAVLVDGAAPSSFSITGVGNPAGGTVTITPTPTAGQRVVLFRDSEVSRETDYQINGDLLAAVVNADFDRLWLVLQEILFGTKAPVASVRAPAGEDLNELVDAASRANKLLSFDSDGQPVALAPTSGDATALALQLATRDDAAEAAGQIGDNAALAYTWGTVGYKLKRYRTLLDLLSSTKAADVVAGTAAEDCQAELQALIDAVSATGGGTIYGHGYTVRTNSPLMIKDGVTLDMQGGKVSPYLSGASDYGINLRNYSRLVNAEVQVVSSGSPGSQAGIHAPVLIGALAGEGGTVASPSAAEGVIGWAVVNCKLSTNADGKVGAQISGGCANGLIDGIEVPDSSVMVGAVHLDWNYKGTITSANIATSRSNFDAGTAYTTHPHNIIIRNIKIGALSRAKSGVDTGAHGVRLSGVYNVTVENVRAKQTTYAFFRVTAGDVGFEFAPAEIKHLAMKGIKFRNGAAESTTDSWLAYVDSYADNVAAAVSGSGYTALMDPLHETDIEVRGLAGKGSGGASVTAGLDIRQIRGGRFVDIDAQGYAHGCLVDEQVFGTMIHGRFHGNRGHGIYVHHATYPPEDVEILRGTHCFQNGQNGAFSNPSGICFDSSVRGKIDGALLGHRTTASETTQTNGIYVPTSSAASQLSIENCHVLSVKSGGVGYALMSTTDYGKLRLFRNNSAASAVSTKMGGVNIIPVSMELGPDGMTRGVFLATEASLTADTTPTAGTWVQGDRIYYTDTDPLDYVGTVCTTGGSPGTWKRFGETL